jgi:hypothetical protein
MPKFFIPNLPAEAYEKLYAELAHLARTAVPEPAKRIFSIRFPHDGVDWTATVGQTLSGSKTKTMGRGTSKREVTQPTSDSAMVLAIFPGHPFIVHTDSGLSHQSRSTWCNPFMAGIPSSVTYFE